MNERIARAQAEFKKAHKAFHADRSGTNHRARELAESVLLHERRRVLRVEMARQAMHDAEDVVGDDKLVCATLAAVFLSDDLRDCQSPSRIEDGDPVLDEVL